MKTSLVLVSKLFLYWMLFFILQRVLFYIHFHQDFESSISELLHLPIYAFKLDFSTTAYFVTLPFIVLFFHQLKLIKSPKIYLKISKWITFILGILTSIIYSVELVSYTEWRSKLTSKIFIHLTTPSEIFRTAFGEFTWWFLLYLMIQIILIYVLYRLIFRKTVQVYYPKRFPYLKLVFGFLVGIFCFVLIARGGIKPIPISITNAYYSNSQILNDLSVNSTWSFIEVSINYNKSNSEKFFTSLSEAESVQLVDELYAYEDVDSVRLFKSTTPDLIFITLEGWSTQLMGCLGGKTGITPNFDELTKEGILFSKIYATSSTSETGHSSIFSGYPTIPRISISHQLAKCRKIPSVVRSLVDYNSAYYFGGSLEYGNIGGYLKEIGFQSIYDEDDLPKLSPKGYLGYHDGAMFPHFLAEIKKAKSPYIYGLFTQSTHSPYDMPEPMMTEYPDSKYASSLRYADKQIKIFIDELKKLPNYENTLVVFISDHGKTNFVNKDIYKDEYFHIPVLFMGGALKQSSRGKVIEKLGSQIDISKTLLNQLNIDTSPFKWSKDLLNPNAKEWAMFSTMNMYGTVTPNGYSNYKIYSESSTSYPEENNALLQPELKKCKAFNESVYREFKEL